MDNHDPFAETRNRIVAHVTTERRLAFFTGALAGFGLAWLGTGKFIAPTCFAVVAIIAFARARYLKRKEINVR